MTSFKLGYQANCWGPLGGDPVGVTSVKDLYYRTFGDMERAFAEIAQAGFQGVEVFDGNLMEYSGKPNAFARLLANSGLKFIAVYGGANFIFPEILEDELWRIRRVAAAAAEAGAEHLVVGGGAQKASGTTEEDYVRLSAALDRVVEIASDHGLLAHYHPHLSTIAETPEQIAKIFSRTKIKFCPDTAHLAAAGGDPATLVRDHFDRISYVHLKGLQHEPFAFTPLGHGDLDLDPLMEFLKARAFPGWITVELDSWAEPKEGARESFRYLERLGQDLSRRSEQK